MVRPPVIAIRVTGFRRLPSYSSKMRRPPATLDSRLLPKSVAECPAACCSSGTHPHWSCTGARAMIVDRIQGRLAQCGRESRARHESDRPTVGRVACPLEEVARGAHAFRFEPASVSLEHLLCRP